MKIHKRRVKRARQISPIGNGERGRGNAKAHMYPPEEEEGWGRHSMLRRGAGTGGLVLAGPVPSRPGRCALPRQRSHGQRWFKHLPPSEVSLSRAKGTLREYFSGFGWFAARKYFQFGREGLWALLGPEGQNPGSWVSRWSWATVSISPCQQNSCSGGKWRLWWAMK